MNRIDRTSQPLELTPVAWIALVVILVMVVARWTRDEDSVQTLDFVDALEPTIVRSEGKPHRFPLLGINITPPEGWSYLSLTDDAVATRPTFVNESENQIVRLHQPWGDEWPRDEVTQVQYANSKAEWIDLKRRRETITFTALGAQLRHEWDQTDHRSIGRLSLGDAELAIITTPRVKSGRGESLAQFCDAIEFVDVAP